MLVDSKNTISTEDLAGGKKALIYENSKLSYIATLKDNVFEFKTLPGYVIFRKKINTETDNLIIDLDDTTFRII